jgi:hypothetical protein
MICSVLPFAALAGSIASRMSFNLSFAVSPACQRLLQRVIEAGIGFLACQAPFANWAKSAQGSTLRSISLTSTPCSGAFWEKSEGKSTKITNRDCRVRIKKGGSPECRILDCLADAILEQARLPTLRREWRRKGSCNYRERGGNPVRTGARKRDCSGVLRRHPRTPGKRLMRPTP